VCLAALGFYEANIKPDLTAEIAEPELKQILKNSVK